MKIDHPLERWPSGLRRTLGKRVYFNEYRGFESHSLRHAVKYFRINDITYQNRPNFWAISAKKFDQRISLGRIVIVFRGPFL
jgi:hypothetical protein